MKRTSILAAALVAAALLLSGCGSLGAPGQSQPDPVMVLMNPSLAADFERLPAPLKSYLRDIAKDAEITPPQKARISAILARFNDKPVSSTASGGLPDFGALFLADPIAPAALRRFFALQDAAMEEALGRSADALFEIRDVFTHSQRERIAAFLLAHPDPLQGTVSRDEEASRSVRPAGAFDGMIAPLLEGVSLTAEQRQRVSALESALAAGAPLPEEPAYYLDKIVTLIRDGNKEAYLADILARQKRAMPVDEIVAAISSLDLAQRKRIAANFGDLVKRFPPPGQPGRPAGLEQAAVPSRDSPFRRSMPAYNGRP